MVGRQLRLIAEKRAVRRGRPKKPGAGVSHLRRSALAARFPVHVTVRVKDDVRNLRTKLCFRALKNAFRLGRERFGFRMVEFSVQGNHIHFLVEGMDAPALSRGMQGLTIRMAKALNRVIGRRGKVFADRYHSHILRTPTEVARARDYVLRNRAHHYHQRRGERLPSSFVDRFASFSAVILDEGSPPLTADPHTWLLREGWKRARIRSTAPPPPR